jgi:hypothetical protein
MSDWTIDDAASLPTDVLSPFLKRLANVAGNVKCSAAAGEEQFSSFSAVSRGD